MRLLLTCLTLLILSGPAWAQKQPEYVNYTFIQDGVIYVRDYDGVYRLPHNLIGRTGVPVQYADLGPLITTTDGRTYAKDATGVYRPSSAPQPPVATQSSSCPNGRCQIK